METLGEKVHRLRRRVGMTQEVLAEKCGVSRRTVNAWECDRVHPTSRHLQALARTLEVDEAYFERDGYETAVEALAAQLARRLAARGSNGVLHAATVAGMAGGSRRGWR
ncbi:MAG: helix-turn-helix transcriptional regulator, partial [Thermoleophilia bacterium]|nr:helix-turn-helix transcriptional regulator [Thermoleophilia bacterium]